MTYCHTSFTRKKNESKKINKKEENEKEKCLVCGQYTNACKLGANLNGQKTIKVDHNNS
jgi:hypothetical protein